MLPSHTHALEQASLFSSSPNEDDKRPTHVNISVRIPKHYSKKRDS